MKVYFTASLSGKQQYGSNYEAVVKVLKDQKLNVFADHILKNEADKTRLQSKEEVEKVYRNLLKQIKLADLVVAEISNPSVSVGHEISVALEMSKPVVALHVEETKSSLVEGIVDEKLEIRSYKLSNLKEVVAKAIEDAKKKMDVRFNFFVSPKILNYLDWVAQKRMVPRSVFLRDLIEKEMRKDKEFRQ